MASFTTNTSDKKKEIALKCWLFGGLGIFGIEYFYVLDFKKAFLRVIVALFIIGLICVDKFHTKPMCIMMILFMVFYSLKDLVTILVGKLQDNVGNYIRE